MPDRAGTPFAPHHQGKLPPDLEPSGTPWHGSATERVDYWRRRALAAEDEVRKLVRAIKGEP